MKRLVLTKKKQLIDLNQDSAIFDIEIKAKTKNSTDEFSGIILSQTDLDSGDFKYKKFKGSLNARIKNDKDIYQNFFLCLKSEHFSALL